MTASAGIPPRLFVYGTLVIPRVLQAVTGKTFASEPAELPGYARFGLQGRTYPGILSAMGESTPGVLYQDVDPATLEILDRFEDDFYERRTVSVRAGDRTVTAVTYVVPDAHRNLVDGAPWDPAAFERDHLDAFLATLDVRLSDPRAVTEAPRP